MSTGQIAAGYAVNQAKTIGRIRPARKIRKEKMKLTFKQRIRNWLLDSPPELNDDHSLYVEEDKLQSEGMRLQIYKANGGYVVETRGYDRHRDRSNYTMHVIKEEDDLGDALGKIVMMEALKA